MAITKTFNWYPDVESRHKVKPLVSTSRFGDGYEQRTPNGLNSTPMVWSVSFTRQRSIGLAILAFLRGCKGSEAFNWTSPLNEAGKYVCKAWDMRTMKGGHLQITCDFEQVFET